MARIAVAGAANDGTTAHLVETLSQEPGVETCTSWDGRSALDPSVDTLIYMAAVRGLQRGEIPDLVDARRVFALAAEGGLRQVVVLSSAAFYEPNAQHPGMVAETFVPSARIGNPSSVAWRSLEALAEKKLGDGEAALTILRLAPVLSADGRDYFSRLFKGRVAFLPPGHDPSLQLLAPDDLAQAVAKAVAHGRAGIFHIVPDGVIPLRRALRLARVWRIPVPGFLQWPLRKAFSAMGLCASPQQLDFVRYFWTLSNAKSKAELGFAPGRSSAEAVHELCGKVGKRAAAVDPRQLRFDDYGMDEEYIARQSRTLLGFLHNVYWRVEVKGLEHVPREGRVMLAGVHRGHQPWDGSMALYLLYRETGRFIRFLIHPSLTKFPFLANFMAKLGGMLACQENADFVLSREGILGVFPEGIRGTFTYYKDAYQLRPFGRNDFVKIALRNRTPIVPFVTVGSAEIFPIYGKIDWSWWKRQSLWPCFPITPTMSLVPLPSKWHTQFLEPMHIEKEYSPEAADDRKIDTAISKEVRRRMEAALQDMLRRRKAIFWGSIFDQGSVTEPSPRSS